MASHSSNLDSFGALLKQWRTRSHLTQQHLATAVGVHRNAVGRWEQGDVLPASKALVLELAHYLALDDAETRQFLEASLTALAPHWYVPMHRNSFFTGREDMLNAIHMHLNTHQAADITQSVALHGLGGVGKTQVAVEYAYRYMLEYHAVFWISAKTSQHIAASFLHIAEILGISRRDAPDQRHVIAAVRHWLAMHGRWLMIWDDLDNLDLLSHFLPTSRSGAVLITTHCETLGTLTHGISMNPMGPMEGLLFLLRRAKILEPGATQAQVRHYVGRHPGQYMAALEIVRAMGGLPQALDQAGAYLEETQCGFTTYLEMFRTRRAFLLQQRGAGALDHPASVGTTLTLAITAAAQRHPAVRDLLWICALLQPVAIPEELFCQGGAHLGPILCSISRDMLAWNQVIATARVYSLVSRQSASHTLTIHRLLQAILLDAMTAAEQTLWNGRIIAALDDLFPDVQSPAADAAVWAQCERLLPHALICLRRAEDAQESLISNSLTFKIAQYMLACGEHARAEPLYRRALHVRERMLGPDHPDLAAILNGLVSLDTAQRQSGQTESL